MSTIIRDTFIALHSSDVLGRLLNEVRSFGSASCDHQSIAYAIFVFFQFRERYVDHKVPVASLRTSQMLKQLGVYDNATDIAARNVAQNNNSESSSAAVETAAMAEEEGEELATENALQRPPTVATLSREQALQLLKPGYGKRRSSSAQEKEDSLEGKFVNLVDLLLPVPTKGEFDVNKIKSSLYFFS